MKKLTVVWRMTIGLPAVAAFATAGLCVPMCLADHEKSMWWLLLWVPAIFVTGVALYVACRWACGGEK